MKRLLLATVIGLAVTIMATGVAQAAKNKNYVLIAKEISLSLEKRLANLPADEKYAMAIKEFIDLTRAACYASCYRPSNFLFWKKKILDEDGINTGRKLRDQLVTLLIEKRVDFGLKLITGDVDHSIIRGNYKDNMYFMSNMIEFNLKGLSKDQMEALIPSLAERIETDDNNFKLDVVTSHLIKVAVENNSIAMLKNIFTLVEDGATHISKDSLNRVAAAANERFEQDKHPTPSEEALIVLFENGADHVMLTKVMRSKFGEEGLVFVTER